MPDCGEGKEEFSTITQGRHAPQRMQEIVLSERAVGTLTDQGPSLQHLENGEQTLSSP